MDSQSQKYPVHAFHTNMEHRRIRHYNAVLEMLVNGFPLHDILEKLVLLLEAEMTGMLGSILIVSADRKRLLRGEAPSLPEFYNEATDGILIADGVGSCGTAAYRGTRVIVDDIGTHPFWRKYKDLAFKAGLRACWSEPIISSDGEILGTFGMFYEQPRKPDSNELDLISHAGQLASIALERSRALQHQRMTASIFEHLPQALMITDANKRILSVNPAFTQISGFDANEIIGQESQLFTLCKYTTPVYREIWKTLATKGVWRGEFDNQRKDGEAYRCDFTYIQLKDQSGVVDRFVVLFSDITERKHAEFELFKEKERAEVTLHSIGDAVITTDAKSIVEYLNPVAEALTGWTLDEAKGRTLAIVFNTINEKTREPMPDAARRCMKEGSVIQSANHTVLIGRSGREYAVQDTAAPIRGRDGEMLGAVLIFKDSTEARRLAAEVAHQASHDGLTGLVNRREFERRIQRVLESCRIDQTEHALCYLDLDQFKVINDTCGHAAGDELLRQLGQMLRDHVRARDTLARLGGDEFGVLIEHCSLDQASRVANVIHKVIDDFRFLWEDKQFHIGASIGLVPIDASTESIASALGVADAACYVAKDRGRNRIHVYHPDDTAFAKRHGEMQWVGKINQALTDNRFRLWFQPIKSLDQAMEEGEHFELLLRMYNPDGSIVMPNVFLTSAERYNIATKLDRWVLDAALQWLDSQIGNLAQLHRCCINLSGSSLGDEDFLSFLTRKCDQTNIPMEKICFEITETAAIANLSNATQFIKTFKERGCTFALDDFGSGLSSYGYLKNLPVDYLKIDGEFIKDIVDEPLNLAMVKSIHEIGHIMGLQTIAEFAENDDILNCLRNIGVDFAQGFGVGKPQPIECFKYD